MQVLNLKYMDESTRTVVKGGKLVSTHTRKTTLVPCIHIVKDIIPRVLGDRVLGRLTRMELLRIEHKPMLQIAHSHK